MGQGDGTTDPEHRAESGEDDPLWQELIAGTPKASSVPPEVPPTSHDSFSWRTIDAELAELAYDSVADHSYAGAMRGSEDTRLLTFEASHLTVEVEIIALGTRRSLIGQLIPVQQARVLVRHQDGIATVEADEFGRFKLEDLPPGPGSLRCQLGGAKGGAPVVTDWITL
jgi:hypothetical protein